MKNMQNNNGKNKKKTKSSDPWARSGERPGRGHGSELFFLFFHGFLQFGQNLEKTKKKQKKTKSSDPWARSGLSTHKPKKQKTKKPRNQKTKKTKIAHPKGRGSDAECWVLSFFFCFFGFLVCVWIAIADVLSRDCQALSVVALEARSIHYSTAMFAMTWCMQPMNSREEWNSILSGCAICCWIFAQEMPQFAHSPGGLF